jgi:hypothetical protein
MYSQNAIPFKEALFPQTSNTVLSLDCFQATSVRTNDKNPSDERTVTLDHFVFFTDLFKQSGIVPRSFKRHTLNVKFDSLSILLMWLLNYGRVLGSGHSWLRLPSAGTVPCWF